MFYAIRYVPIDSRSAEEKFEVVEAENEVEAVERFEEKLGVNDIMSVYRLEEV